MSLLHSVKKKLQKKGEPDSMAWQFYAVEKLPVLESAIQDMVRRKDKVPTQLLEVACVILKTISDIKVIVLLLCPSVRMNDAFQSLKDHKRVFERLLAEVSAFVVIVWQRYIDSKVKYHSLAWPPPKLKNFLDELVEYVFCHSEWCKTFTLVIAWPASSMSSWGENPRRTLPNESYWVTSAYETMESSINISRGCVLWHYFWR